LRNAPDILPGIGLDGIEDDPFVLVVGGRQAGAMKRVRSAVCARLASVTIAESAM